MPQIKLTYFDLRGRAETARLMLTIGDIPFTDDRVSFPQWKQVKPTTPYGSLPTMTVDGQLIAQSSAIDRYCATLAGLYPPEPLPRMQVDEVTATLADLLQAVFKYRGDDKEQLKLERQKYVQVDVPRYAGGLEKRLQQFGAGPYAVGDALSLADVSIFTVVTTFKAALFDHVASDVMDQYQRISAIHKLVSEHPKVVQWYQQHPVKKAD